MIGQLMNYNNVGRISHNILDNKTRVTNVTFTVVMLCSPAAPAPKHSHNKSDELVAHVYFYLT